MKWLKSTLVVATIVGATAVSGSAFAFHRHWHGYHYAPRADVSLGFTIGAPWYAPAPRYYYYDPAPAYYYGPRYQYYGYAPGYHYWYGEPVYDFSHYNSRFPRSGEG